MPNEVIEKVIHILKLIDLFYDLTSSKDFDDSGETYRIWGILADGQFFYLSPKEQFDFINYDLERDGDRVLSAAQSAFWQVVDGEDSCVGYVPWYIEYEDCKFLFETEVVIEGAVDFEYFMCPYVTTKGSCGKKCGDISYDEPGHYLDSIPSCDAEKIIDAGSYTEKWATIYGYIADACRWMRQCKDLDVAINVHWIYDANEQKVSADSCAYCAFIIQGDKLTITPKDLGKIYLKYHGN